VINVLGNSRILFGGNFGSKTWDVTIHIGSMYGIYANIWGILMVNVTIYSSTMDPMGYCTIEQLGQFF